MSQYDFGDLESPLSGTAFFNTHLEPWRDALHSMHKGSSRPSYAVGGMIWVDDTTTPWLLKMFNGTANDITLGSIDPTNFWFQPTGTSVWGGSAGGTANALTLTPTIPWTAYDTGKPIECLITATNTSSTVTINISALGTKNVKASIGGGKVNVPKGALQNGMIARFVYDGTDLLLLNVRAYNKGADIATASTINLDTATGDYVTLTGTTTVTDITLSEGREVTCVAAAAFTLTDGSGNSPQDIILPTGANISVAAGDVFTVRGEASGATRIVNYLRADGTPVGGTSVDADSLAKAWVNFNGTGTVAIRDSYNVSSITDNATGDYTVNFTNNMANTNYALAGSAGLLASGASAPRIVAPYDVATQLVGSSRIAVRDDLGIASDCAMVSAVYYGELA